MNQGEALLDNVYQRYTFFFHYKKGKNMKVRAIDAIDSMGLGGYIDRDTGKYIPPQWYIERFEEMKGS